MLGERELERVQRVAGRGPTTAGVDAPDGIDEEGVRGSCDGDLRVLGGVFAGVARDGEARATFGDGLVILEGIARLFFLPPAVLPSAGFFADEVGATFATRGVLTGVGIFD